MKRNLILSIVCSLLIILWAYTSISKWSEFKTFGFQLQKQPLPVWFIPILKWGLPLVELITAVLIYFQRTRMKGFIISAILMFSFTLYVAIALSGAFGKIPCSCAGLISAFQWRGHLVFNIFFTAISVVGIYLQKYKDARFVKHKTVVV